MKKQNYRRMSKLLPAALLSAVFLAGCGQGEKGQAPEYVLTYAENQAEDYPTTQGAYRFAELVKERTDGRIEIQVNADGSLGDEQSVVEQMQFGGIDFSRVSLGSLAEFAPQFNALQLPYLYNSSEHMWRVLEGEIGDQFMQSLDGYNLVGLSWYDAGARSFYNSLRPIERLEDMKGLKIRVQESVLMADTVKALGAEPVQMPYGNVYSALQIGEVDGAENNWPSYESTRHYEVAKYFSVDEHTRVPEMQLISQVTWDKMTSEDQKILRECAEESARYERQLWTERERYSEERVRAAGCIVNVLSEAEKERFRDAVMPMYEKYCSEYIEIVDAIVAAGRE